MTGSTKRSSSARVGPGIALVGLTLGLVSSRLAGDARTRSPQTVESAAVESRTRADFLKLIARPRVLPAPEIKPLQPAGRLAQERFTFASEAGERVPGIVVKPGAPGRHAVVVILHGTGDSKEGMLPLVAALAGRGFLAVAIDGRYHGERERQPAEYTTAMARVYRTDQGHPFLYDTVWDVLRLVDYLSTRPDVDPAKIGLMGISKGGMETYLAAAVDPRIAVAIPIISAQSFRWALEHDAWQARVGTIAPAVQDAARSDGVKTLDAAFVRRFYDRVVPGIYGEFDGPAMLPLISPRPLLVINGDRDGLTPLAGVQECASAAERAYRAGGSPDRFRLLIQPGAGHEFTGDAQRAALDWLVKWLRP
jgi:dienelactone hydrolase